MKKIAIVGFGGAGYHAAKEIRKWDPLAVIDVYADTALAPYNPMLTTYYVKGALPYQALFPFGGLKEIAEELALNIHTECPVIGLESETRTLILSDGTRAFYDEILFSTGASAVMPPFPGLDLPFMGLVNQTEIHTPLGELMALNFAMQELGLYLDTHQNDAEARELFRQYSALYREGRTAYEAQYGPLQQMDGATEKQYTWLQDPWPWDYVEAGGDD